jgi:hypothetical protein
MGATKGGRPPSRTGATVLPVAGIREGSAPRAQETGILDQPTEAFQQALALDPGFVPARQALHDSQQEE